MKIKTNKIINKFIQPGLTLERTSKNIIEISSQEDIPISIILPENFELEIEAAQQLINFAHFKSVHGKQIKCACATPDFHKGSFIPVGAVVVSDKDMVIPCAIGTDINCGMRLHHLGINIENFLSKKKEFINVLKGDLLEGTRNIPTTGKAMQALFKDGLSAFWLEMQKKPIGMFDSINFNQVLQELNGLHISSLEKGNLKYAPENLINRDIMRDPNIGTIGGGNHFAEFQIVKEVIDRKKTYELGIKVGDVVSMIHTGSRDVGFYIGNRWMDLAKEKYPKGIKHPKNKIYALEGFLANEYLSAMHSAAHYATANRALISEIIRQRSLSIYGNIDNRLIVDVPHNIIIQEDIGNVHRKGATPAYNGQLLLIPGSMGSDSYLLTGLGNEKWLKSSSHGAGRSFSRNKMSFKGKKDLNSLGLKGIECITLKEERLIEEAPSAYKDISSVIQSQVEEKTIDIVAIFSPLVTFKA